MGSGANLDLLRGTNDAAVLEIARCAEHVTRPRLAREMGMTVPAIAKILTRQCERGLMEECGTDSSGRGRPTTLYRLVPQSRRAIGVHVSHTAVRAVVADLAGRPLDVRTAGLSPDADAETMLATMVDAVRSVQDVGPGSLVGVGVGMPGSVDHATGYFRGSDRADPWRQIPLRDILTEALGLRVLVDNDSTAAVVAEAWGDPEGTRDTAVVVLEDGIGLGLQLGGVTQHGVRGDAGEIGHTVVAMDGELCVCGRRGCAQTEHALAWDRGDGERAAQVVGTVLVNLVHLTDIDRIVLAGRFFDARRELYLSAAQEALDQERERHPWHEVELRTSTRDPDLIALGAAAEVLEDEYGMPRPLSDRS